MSTSEPAKAPTIDPLLAGELRFGENLKRTNPGLWWGTLVGPLAATLAMLVVAAVVRGLDFVLNLCVSAAMIFFGLGRAVLFVGRDGSTNVQDLAAWERVLMGMTVAELGLLIVWMDVLVAFLIVFHASYLYRIPKLGPAMLALQEDGQFILSQHPWLRRFAWLGLIAFVAFPFAATGSIGGSIVGRILGLSRWSTLTGVILGSVISTAAAFAVTNSVKKTALFSDNNPWTIVGSIVFILVLFALINWRYQRMKKRWAAEGRRGVATIPMGDSGQSSDSTRGAA
ncbi:MAG: small multi-drug export protein [Planctomycetota bacterium]|nr:small multi-drug export protein [Planctomycetota bacterium]